MFLRLLTYHYKIKVSLLFERFKHRFLAQQETQQKFCQHLKFKEVFLRLFAKNIITSVMQLSHLSRFDHDWYRGLHRGPIGTIASNLIRSHHILVSIIIGLIMENFLSAKNFATIGGTIVTIASDRMTS